MRLAIMQPYFFPYQGYFQLLAAVDKFVLYDDVAFIKNGWINRNRILSAAGVEYITVP
ncbi:MAG: WbqC family protein, partial [Polyangiales bacterium]